MVRYHSTSFLPLFSAAPCLSPEWSWRFPARTSPRKASAADGRSQKGPWVWALCKCTPSHLLPQRSSGGGEKMHSNSESFHPRRVSADSWCNYSVLPEKFVFSVFLDVIISILLTFFFLSNLVLFVFVGSVTLRAEHVNDDRFQPPHNIKTHWFVNWDWLYINFSWLLALRPVD